MTLNQLRAFQAVARHLNITRAAKDIRISQPVISKQLKLLEEEFGVKLHLTTGQGIRLTEQGHAFLSGVDHILNELDKLQLSVGNTARPEKIERFVLGANDSSAAFLLPQALKTFHEARPNVHPILRIGSSRTIEQMIINSEIEMGFTTNLSYDPRLVVETLTSDETVAFVSTRHQLTVRRRLTRQELSEIPFVTRIGSKSVRKIEEKGIQLNIVIQCESSDSVKSAVEAGLGVGLLYRGSVELGLRSGYFKAITLPELQSVDVKCYLIYRKGESLSMNAQYFLSIVNQ
jgi:LysR family transcriptional regulator, low CO2-responsive transcriptional regulator